MTSLINIKEYDAMAKKYADLWKNGATKEIREAAKSVYYSIMGTMYWHD